MRFWVTTKIIFALKFIISFQVEGMGDMIFNIKVETTLGW